MISPALAHSNPAGERLALFRRIGLRAIPLDADCRLVSAHDGLGAAADRA